MRGERFNDTFPVAKLLSYSDFVEFTEEYVGIEGGLCRFEECEQFYFVAWPCTSVKFSISFLSLLHR